MDTLSIHNPVAQANTQKPKEKEVQLPEQASSQAKIALESKAKLNVSILEATEATLGVKDQPLALVLKSAIAKINEVLAPELGDDAIQKAFDAGIDFSPEATAERIVSFSTGFFSAYQEQHPELSTEDALNGFLDVIGGGIQQGFDEARNILDGLQVLKGDIADNIDQTFTLVQTGLGKFKDMILAPPASSAGN